jgi:threonine dehydrogenase-like Zn-dependent dehydrogenase
LLGSNGIRIIGMAPDAPGGFGEYFMLTELLARAVPSNLEPERIALNDAMAVGWFSTRLGVEHAPEGAVALVIGLGAIGQSVVSALTHRALGPIVAEDFSPSRREDSTSHTSRTSAPPPRPRQHGRHRPPGLVELVTTVLRSCMSHGESECASSMRRWG